MHGTKIFVRDKEKFEIWRFTIERKLAKEKETTSLPSRANNKDWCKCGRCRPMETEEESKCCRDNGEVPESYFSEHLCITSHANFTFAYKNKY